MTAATRLSLALNQLRLPPRLQIEGLARTTRPSKAALLLLRASKVRLRPNDTLDSLSEVQSCLEAAAPGLLRTEVDIDAYLHRAQAAVADEANHRLVGEGDVHAFLDRNLVKHVNVIVHRLFAQRHIKPYWHSQMDGTSSVTRPDWSWSCRTEDGQCSTIASAELKTNAAIRTLSPIPDAFHHGLLKLDESNRAMLGWPAVDPSKPRRRNGLEHAIDHCMTQMIDTKTSLAVITNYKEFLLVDGGTETDHCVVSFAPLVSVASASTPAALYDSPLGLLLGVTLAALRRCGIRLDTL